jgi:ABC-type transporter Mla subunit MlaD
VRDDVLLKTVMKTVVGAEHLGTDSQDPVRFAAVWNGVVHEFRNHLTLLLAGTTELRSGLPATLAADMAETLDDMEGSVQSVNGLLGALDSAMKDGDQLLCEVDVVIERALAMAAPTLGGVNITVKKSRPAAVKNVGTAVECALAALLSDLARSSDFRRRVPGLVPVVPPQIRINVQAERGSLVIEVESSASSPPPTSWRVLLATFLAARVGCTLERLPPRPAFVFRFQ